MFVEVFFLLAISNLKYLRDDPWDNREIEPYKKILPTLLTYAKERACKITYKFKILAFFDLHSNGYERNIKDFWEEF
jgi:hypothetical protein